MDITITLNSSELEQVLIGAQERRQALEAGSRYYDTEADRAWARAALSSIDSALEKLRFGIPVYA